MADSERPGPESPPSPSRPPPSAFAGAVGRLTLLNVVVTGVGVVSGTLQARALGPRGRGDLAAILLPLFFLGWIGDFGLGLYVRREAARTTSLGRLVGTVVAVVFGLGLLLAAVLFPAIDAVARDRDVVRLWLTLGLVVLPLNLVGSILLNVAFGLERWELWVRSRLVVSVGWAVVLAVLYAADRLTVGTAAATLAGLTVLSYLPLLAVLIGARPLRFDRRLVRESVPFAARAWLASLTNLFNMRLDQLLMVGLVGSRELGLYVVAVTLAGIPGNFSSAVGLAILPRVVREGEDVVPRALRTVVLIVLVSGAILAAAAWPLVHFVVGESFADALPMIWVLLVAEVPLAGTITLGQAFIGAGQPGRAAWAEGMAVAVTFVGLLLLVGPLGGVGAALVSLVAYSLSFGYLLVQARARFGGAIRTYVVPSPHDARWGLGELRRLTSRSRSASEPPRSTRTGSRRRRSRRRR